MKIYMHSTVFEPSVGGVETVGELLAGEWLKTGADVKISTDTPGPLVGNNSIPVIRCPRRSDVIDCVRWADVVFHNHPATRWAWVPQLYRKPWYATVHTWLPMYHAGGGMSQKVRAMMQRRLMGDCQLIAVSEAIAAHLPRNRTRVIWNPCRFSWMGETTNRNRAIDVLFVGRLVPDKGVDLLLDALVQLAAAQCYVRTKIIGDGPLKASLREQAKQAGLAEWIQFAGTQAPDTLQDEFAAARCTVVPSRWEEPFGLVAIEALACGSIPVVADSGGLPEAVGPHGLVFPRGDAKALAEILQRIVKGEINGSFVSSGAIEAQLAHHDPAKVAARYLDVFSESL